MDDAVHDFTMSISEYVSQAALKAAKQISNSHTVARLEMAIKQREPEYNWELNQRRRMEEKKMKEKLVREVSVPLPIFETALK